MDINFIVILAWNVLISLVVVAIAIFFDKRNKK